MTKLTWQSKIIGCTEEPTLLHEIPAEVWELLKGKIIKEVFLEPWGEGERLDGHKALRFNFEDGTCLRVMAEVSYTPGNLCMDLEQLTEEWFYFYIGGKRYSRNEINRLPFRNLRYKVGDFSPVGGDIIIPLTAFPEGYFRGEPICGECDDLSPDGTPAEWLVIQQNHHRVDGWFWCGCTLAS